MKDIQIRNTRSVNRQSTGPPIITSSTSVRTNTTTAVNSKPPSTVVSANQNGGPTAAKPIPPTSVKVVPAVVKSERFVPPRRHQSAVTATAAGQGSEEKPAPRGTITTRSATSAIVKQNTTSPRVK
uniref:Uncharacterized protein n=1 Tax=Anopheles maculatus TaxID=74869 RepID=A0A182T4E2_9DIPT